MRASLDWMFTECAVAGCHCSRGLEGHHLVDYSKTGHTTLKELVPICESHHDRITHEHHRLERRPDGQYDLLAPTDHARDERGPPVAA